MKLTAHTPHRGKVRNEWSCISISLCVHSVERDNFIFTYILVNYLLVLVAQLTIC